MDNWKHPAWMTDDETVRRIAARRGVTPAAVLDMRMTDLLEDLARAKHPENYRPHLRLVVDNTRA